MKPLIALLILGSIVTSASAAGTDIHGLVDGQTGHTVISEQQSQLSPPPISDTSRAIDISAVALRTSGGHRGYGAKSWLHPPQAR
jgi:hypothetical protein